VRVFVNGEPREVEDGATVAELLEAIAAPRQGVAVEVNLAIVRRADLPARRLSADDRVEVVGLVGGG
jgi:sulfur carrier protein